MWWKNGEAYLFPKGSNTLIHKPPDLPGNALIVPDINSTKLWQIDSPKPEPPDARLRDSSTRYKRSKS